MHAPGKTLDDHLVQVARQRADLPVVNFNNIQCECSVHSSQVFMDFGPRSEKHAPYLHLLGEVREVRFPESMQSHMYGVTALTFAEGTGLQTDIFYKFSQSELVDMVQKGYFDKGFEIPDILKENDFELPLDCNLTMIEPQREDDPPIIFVGLTNPRNVEFTSETSGYELGSYFEPVKSMAPVQSEPGFDDEFDSDDVEFAEMSAAESLFHVEMPQPADPVVQDEDDYVDDYSDESVADTEPEEEDEAAILMRHYTSISASVGSHMKASRADIDRQIRKASGKPVEEPVPVVPDDVPVEPSVPVQSDIVEPSVVGHKDEQSGAGKSAAAAKKAALAEYNQDANADVPKTPRQVPADLKDIADQADAEFVDSGDFGDAL